MRKLLIGLTAFWIVVAFGGGAWLSQRLQPEAGPWQYMYLIVACMSWLTLALLCGALVRLWPEPEGERIKFEKRPESESPQIDQIVRFYWSGKTDVAWTKLIRLSKVERQQAMEFCRKHRLSGLQEMVEESLGCDGPPPLPPRRATT